MDFLIDDMGVPYFMGNKDWYYYDEEEEIYKLTDKATEKARQSYIEAYSEDDDIY